MKTVEEIIQKELDFRGEQNIMQPSIEHYAKTGVLSGLLRSKIKKCMESYSKEYAINFAEHYHTSISSYAKSQKPTEYYYDNWTNPNQP